MGRVLATAVAVLAVGLFGLALLLLTVGNLQGAGLTFLSASLVIYFRETRLVDS